MFSQNKAEYVLKGEFHSSVAFFIATLCIVNAFESYPLTLYHEKTQKFRKRSKRSQVSNLAWCGWHNMAAHKQPRRCLLGFVVERFTGEEREEGEGAERERLKAVSHPFALLPNGWQAVHLGVCCSYAKDASVIEECKFSFTCLLLDSLRNRANQHLEKLPNEGLDKGRC